MGTHAGMVLVHSNSDPNGAVCAGVLGSPNAFRLNHQAEVRIS
jgi:hypothetical protein